MFYTIVPIFLLVLVNFINSQEPNQYNPVVNPKASVVLDNARFSVLSPNLIRMEHSKVKGTFDDRPSMQIVNRYFSEVPQFTTETKQGALIITTSSLKLTYVPTNSSADLCATAQKNTDQQGGVRVPKYPNGLKVSSQGDCCSACNNDTSCTAWVYDTNPDSINCWLMMNVQGTVPATDRVFGGGEGGFTPDNLKIEFKVNDKDTTWVPQQKNSGNLGGTLSALDCYSTKEKCVAGYKEKTPDGLLSTDGWVLLDDTHKFRFVENKDDPDIPWFDDSDFTDTADWYFSVSPELDFKQTISEFASVSGFASMPPRTAFGVWWSRYYAYSQKTFTDEVLSGYADNDIPLSQVVLDMDWHIEPKTEGCQSWGGVTWNTDLFPDPESFVSWLHSSSNTLKHPLKLLLNVHPQTGIDHCQQGYAEFAKLNNVDPSTNKTISCNLGDKTFASTLFSFYYNGKPLEGVDYFWTDYGGCGGANGEALAWSNYYYDQHLQTHKKKRPLVLSRNGGLGNQRYPIGFSGDTFQAFLTLQYEIQMTPQAANVLFAYWSHDIGGFHSGTGSPGDSNPSNVTGSELLLRWIQTGVFLPILRTHCNHCERRIWEFPIHYKWMKQAMILRNALLPYTYTHARKTWETGVAFVHPMYYEDSKSKEAYSYQDQYMFGDDIVVAPISWIVDKSTNKTQKEVWLPQGSWSSWNGDVVHSGGNVVNKEYGLGDIPSFVRVGTILALQTIESVSLSYSSTIIWTIFPGAVSGHTEIYEDDGESLDYLTSPGATTEVDFAGGSDAKMTTVNVSATKGNFDGLPSSRNHIVQIRGASSFHSQDPTSVSCNEKDVPKGNGNSTFGYYWNTEEGLDITPGALIVICGEYSIKDKVVVKVNW